MRTLAERIQGKIEADPVTGCWLWTGALCRSGYGKIPFHPVSLAHRAVYELYRGPIPEGLQLDHLCRVHGCVNPDHLEPVTQLENARRGYYATKTHCPKGHPYDQANTYVRPNGRRTCRVCNRMAVAALHARKAGAA